MSSYGEEKIKCPFYKRQTKNCITCEGIFSISSFHSFANPKKKKCHMSIYCNDDYTKCPHYQEVNKKYD